MSGTVGRTATYLRHAMTKEGIRMCTEERGIRETEYWSYWIHDTSEVDYAPKRTGTASMRRLEDLEALACGGSTPPGWTSDKGVGFALDKKGDSKGYKDPRDLDQEKRRVTLEDKYDYFDKDPVQDSTAGSSRHPHARR